VSAGAGAMPSTIQDSLTLTSLILFSSYAGRWFGEGLIFLFVSLEMKRRKKDGKTRREAF